MEVLCSVLLVFAQEAWKRHTIDGTSKGADGVRLADANGDGRLDIVTGWEQGGVVRVYLHPGPEKARPAWPAVTVARVKDVEDAVFADLDGDGALEVVSSCEGKTQSIFVSWGRVADPDSWKTEPLPASAGRAWMFVLPLQVDGKRGIDLVAGGKNKGAEIGWYESPADPRKLADWKWHKLRDAGWIMSLVAQDMDGDGDVDIVFSDRKGKRTGAFWLENPTWTEHVIGGQGREVMFITLADLDQDGRQDVLAAVKPAEVLHFRRVDAGGKSWETRALPFPPNTGHAKGVGVGDLDLDGKPDVVFSCEGAEGAKSGVMWLKNGEGRQISGPDGVKFDLVELLDVDGDGDLDVLTCEENENLGVIWYENPHRR